MDVNLRPSGRSTTYLSAWPGHARSNVNFDHILLKITTESLQGLWRLWFNLVCFGRVGEAKLTVVQQGLLINTVSGWHGNYSIKDDLDPFISSRGLYPQIDCTAIYCLAGRV